MKNWKIAISAALIIVVAAIIGTPYAYKLLDKNYQKAHDPIRIGDIKKIANIAFEYTEKVGYPPLLDLVEQQNKPFMVLIGRSSIEEDQFANLKALNKGAFFINSTHFEKILTKGLGKEVKLPRDPQKVATYAPNVYVYLVNEDQICVAAHLYFKSEVSKPYTWPGGTFYSHALCYSQKK